MTARTHDAFAFASLLTVAAYFPPASLNVTTLGASVIGNIVGCLIPDMDQASNRLWDLLPLGDSLGRVFKNVFLGHRNITHSLLGLLLIYKIIGFILVRVLNPQYVDVNIVFASVMIGYVSHLIADSVTKEGLPLFFPFKFKIGFPPFSFLRIKTGTWIEKFIVFPSIITYIILFVGSHRDQFAAIFNMVSSR